jgi:ABC-type Na+ transport system ATPase subunit NatA
MISIKNLYLRKKIPEISDLNLQVKKGETYVLLSSGDTVNNHLINIFMGLEHNFTGKITVDDQDISSSEFQWKKDVVCLDISREWPPVLKMKNLMMYIKRVMDISEDQFEEFKLKINLDQLYQKRITDLADIDRRKILFSIARLRECQNFVFYDFTKGMSIDFILEFKENLRQLKDKGCSILYICSDVFFAPEIGNRIGFMKKGKLLLELKGIKVKKMNLKELYFRFLSED